MIEQILFYFFAIIAVAAAIFVISGRNPISCAISLIVTLGSLAGLFVLLDAHFVATIQILVYAGAIMVLFVFVIMLLNLGPQELENIQRFSRFKIVGGVFAAIGAGILAWNLGAYRGAMPEISRDYGTLRIVSRTLFTQYLIPFEVISVLLMSAVVGAVIIAKRDI